MSVSNSLLSKIRKDAFNEIPKLDIKQLEEVIIAAAHAYYNTDKTLVSDEIYDVMIDYLKLKSPKSKVLKTVGASVSKKVKVKIPYWMGSMDKIKPCHVKEFERWKSKNVNPYVISDKLDGISALIVVKKVKDKLETKLYSRGKGEEDTAEGLDITSLIKYLKLPKFKDEMVIRGELIMSKSNFENWSSKFKNSRNLVAGVVNSKTIDPEVAQDIDFVAYQLFEDISIEDQFKTLKKLGVQVVNYKKVQEINFEMLSEYFKDRRSTGEHEVDGIIVTNNSVHKRNTSGNPKYAFAFKDVLEDQKTKAKVLKVTWDVSKDGYLKPVIRIEKTRLCGVDIENVTAHNAKFIVDNKIGKGSVIEIIRSGDVIPKVVGVIKEANPMMPDVEYKWNKTQVDLIAIDGDSKDVQLKNILFFFTKLNISSLKEGNVKKLYEAGFTSVEKIVNAKEKDFLIVDGFKEKTAKNVYDSIHSVLSSVNKALFMAATNKLGRGIGFRKIKSILRVYPNILEDEDIYDKLINLEGFDVKTAKLFVEGIPDYEKFYKGIKKHVKFDGSFDKQVNKKSNNNLNKSFVFSGFRNKDWETKIEETGGSVKTSVSKNVDYLVVKDKTVKSGKTVKAVELGVSVISQNDFEKMLKI